MNIEPISVKDEEWAAKFDELYPGRGGYTKWVLPRAFVHDGNKLYAKHSVWQEARSGNKWALWLIAHEVGHITQVPKEGHPIGIRQGLAHAVSVGFDIRAFTGLLRFRLGPHGAHCVYVARNVVNQFWATR